MADRSDGESPGASLDLGPQQKGPQYEQQDVTQGSDRGESPAGERSVSSPWFPGSTQSPGSRHADEGPDIDQLSSDDDSETEQMILDPEHPLMVKFQEALGNQLRKRLEQLELDERDLNVNLVAKKKERTELGVSLYAEQQSLALCQAKLDSVNQNLQSNTAQRLNREAEMTNIRKLYKKVASDGDETRQQVSSLQKELDNLNMRVFYLLDNQEDVRSDVKVMRRAALKTRKDVTAQEEENKKQDYRVDLLVELIDQRKTEIAMLKAQLAAQASETFRYKGFLDEADMELAVLSADVKQVTSNWKATLLGMKRRDESLADMLNVLEEEDKNLRCKEKEIDAYRKNLLQCEETHEKLTYMLTRTNRDIDTSRKLKAKTEKRHNELKISYVQKSRVLQTVEKAIVQVVAVKEEKIAEKLNLRKEYEQSVLEKNTTTEQLYNTLQAQSACTKAAQYVRNKAHAVMHRSAKLENDMSIDENDLARIECDLLTAQANIVHNKELLGNGHEEVLERNDIITNYELSYQRNHIKVERRQKCMDDCNRVLAKLLEKREGNEVSPLENLVLNLSKSLRKESNNMMDDQTSWVEKQHQLLNLTQEQKDVEANIKHRNQDVIVLTGKRMKLDAAIAKESNERKFYEVDMRHLRVEMEKVAMLLTNKKGQRADMATDGNHMETEFMRELKELEVHDLTLQDKILDLQQEKEDLLNRVVHLEKQSAWWERKLQIGVEMKAAVDPKNNKNADLHGMKCEIHRMYVRHQSLMREQARLIRCMEESVTRREYIVSGQRAAARRNPDELTKTKVVRRSHEAKQKIAKFKKEMIEMDEERKQLTNERTMFGGKLDKKKTGLVSTNDETKLIEDQIKELNNVKFKNLNELVMRQRKVTLYSDVKSGKYKPLYRAASVVDTELGKEQHKMRCILDIISTLQTEFPDATDVLQRVICCYGHTVY